MSLEREEEEAKRKMEHDPSDQPEDKTFHHIQPQGSAAFKKAKLPLDYLTRLLLLLPVYLSYVRKCLRSHKWQGPFSLS